MTTTLSSLAESILGPIEWRDAVSGYCRCPGADLHTSPNGKRDTRVNIDGAPTVHCFHSSCKLAVERANLELRRAFAKGASTTPFRPSREQIEAHRQRERERQQQERLKAHAKASLSSILADLVWHPTEIREQSPIRLPDKPDDDWRLLLGMFDPAAVLWIGDVKDSCNDDADSRRKAECRRHFRPVSEWLNEPAAPGQFTCPSLFKNSIHSRSNENVIGTPFLVVESDSLAKSEIGAVFLWLAQFLTLRAIVDTAGKSLHGWFDRPEPASERELKIILPELGCDPALFKPSQPCRLPGARRGDRFQSLLFIDKGGLNH